MRRALFGYGCFVMLVGTVVFTAQSEDVTATKHRLLEDIKFLASDELEGRGVGTKGLIQAAEFVKNEFAKAGLAVDRVNGDAFQKFDILTGSKLVEPNFLQFVGPDGATIDLKIGTDVEVCSFAGKGPFEADVVFCGYAINTESEKDHSPHTMPKDEALKDVHAGVGSAKASDVSYNDFADVDVAGKVVIVMRRNPRQRDPKSPLGSEHGVSHYASLRTKMTQLAVQKVAAVIFVNDPYTAKKAAKKRRRELKLANQKVVTLLEEFLSLDPSEGEKTTQARSTLVESINQIKSLRDANEKANDDELMKFGYAGNGDSSLPPGFHLSASICNQLLDSAETDLTKLESQIDSDLKPRSFLVSGWKAKGVATVEKDRSDVFNVIGVIDGNGPLADETVIVGAHYDHVGRGGQNSLAPGSKEIHNGADDNASGTVALVELARRFGVRARKTPLNRRLVFIAFTGEELGLLGSERYCKHPLFPLDKTIAMLNMDMVGRSSEDSLIVFGIGTSSRWETDLKQSNEQIGFNLKLRAGGFGPSDHASFYKEKIPVLHFFSGDHADYHKPSDDWEKINVEGMARVVDLVEKMLIVTLDQTERPQYIAVKGGAEPLRSGNRPYVGTLPNFGNEAPGYAISGVAPGSPAELGGLKGGDRIVKVGKSEITNLEDYDAALRTFTPGTEVEFVVVRDQQEVVLKVKLAPPR